MLFSIITVCYNAQENIEKTMQSVFNQTFTDYEYIVKDGNSSDSTYQIAERVAMERQNVKLLCGSDMGIYDAMNQAINQASGEYVFFLNAGDTFADEKVLEDVSIEIGKRHCDILFGNIFLVRASEIMKRKYGRIYCSPIPFILGDSICHQAIFAKCKLLKTTNFDINYKICADREWFLKCMRLPQIKIATIDIVTCSFQTDGYSRNHLSEYEKEAYCVIKKYYPCWSWIYRCYIRYRYGRNVES